MGDDFDAELAAMLATDGPVDGAELLNDVETFLGRFVAYPSEAARVAHALWIAHTWLMDRWDSTPRIAFLSPEPGSGKSRALEVTEPLVPRPVHAVNTSPAYLFRKVSDPAGPPTILYDEIDTVFGPKAKDNEDVRGMLNAGHRRGAVAGRCVVKGQQVMTEELPAYAAVALAGLDDLPDTIRTRSVIVRMRRRAPGERIEPWRHRVNGPEGAEVADQLRRWAEQSADLIRWPDMPAAIQDRDADVWEALLAVADLAGGQWPSRGRAAAVALVAAAADQRQSLGVQLLADLRRIFAGDDVLATETILERLNRLEDAPWGDLRGKPLDPRGLARRLHKYEVASRKVKIDGKALQGYRREHLWDAWTRYLAPPPENAEPAEPVEHPWSQGGVQVPPTEEVPEPVGEPEPITEAVTRQVPEVPQVPHLSGAEPGCQARGDWTSCGATNCALFKACTA